MLNDPKMIYSFRQSWSTTSRWTATQHFPCSLRLIFTVRYWNHSTVGLEENIYISSEMTKTSKTFKNVPQLDYNRMYRFPWILQIKSLKPEANLTQSAKCFESVNGRISLAQRHQVDFYATACSQMWVSRIKKCPYNVYAHNDLSVAIRYEYARIVKSW